MTESCDRLLPNVEKSVANSLKINPINLDWKNSNNDETNYCTSVAVTSLKIANSRAFTREILPENEDLAW